MRHFRRVISATPKRQATSGVVSRFSKFRQVPTGGVRSLAVCPGSEMDHAQPDGLYPTGIRQPLDEAVSCRIDRRRVGVSPGASFFSAGKFVCWRRAQVTPMLWSAAHFSASLRVGGVPPKAKMPSTHPTKAASSSARPILRVGFGVVFNPWAGSSGHICRSSARRTTISKYALPSG